MRMISFLLAVCLGASVAVNYHLVCEGQDSQTTIEFLIAHNEQLQVDQIEARSSAVYWSGRAQVVAQERDNAKRILSEIITINPNLRKINAK